MAFPGDLGLAVSMEGTLVWVEAVPAEHAWFMWEALRGADKDYVGLAKLKTCLMSFIVPRQCSLGAQEPLLLLD